VRTEVLGAYRLNIPPDLKYTRTHEWVKIEGEVFTMGLTDFAQAELGDITYITQPSPGLVVARGDSLGVVESVKTASDYYAPVAGEVSEVNQALGAQSELMNSDPYGQGWVLKLKASDAGADLLDAEAYKAVVAAGGH
jgi:glycine cleavage system H protein